MELKYSDITPGKGKWKDLKATDIPSYDNKNRNISDEIFELISNSYASIGGHIDFKTAKDIPADHTEWKLIDIDKDPDPDIVQFSKKTSHGIKSTGSATDGSNSAKKKLIDKKVKDLNKSGNYGEVSGAIAHILISRHNIPFVDNKNDVEKVLRKKIKWIGEHSSGKYPNHPGWYSRTLGGKKHLKIMVGKPKI